MSPLAQARSDLLNRLRERAIPEDVVPMERYMKNRFSFLGVKSKERRAAQRAVLSAARSSSTGEVLDLASWCWDQPYREFQYVGCDLLRTNANRMEPSALPPITTLIETKTWWDTVDPIATRTIGPMVSNHPQIGRIMDDWISSDNLWLARVAILHQLFFKENTDSGRLFDYCKARASDQEFFVRKAIGWALREFSKTDPTAVRQFLESAPGLSALSRREASKYLS